nr:hypothetical protein [Tanacetum cinerariifolium]
LTSIITFSLILIMSLHLLSGRHVCASYKGSIDDIKSTLTQSALDALCEKFYIPDTVHLELPGPKGTRKKRKTTSGASGSTLPHKRLREDYGTSGASTVGKSLVVLQDLLESITLASDVDVTAAGTVPFVTSSVTPTPERESDDRTDSIIGPNLRTQHPAERSSVPPLPVLTTAVATTTITYVPKWNVINDSALDDPKVCRSMVDQLAPPGFFTQLRGMDYDQLFAKFNVGVARQACFSAEVRLRSEYNYRVRKKFENKCQRQADFLTKRDVEIASLRAQRALKEAEAAEAIHLHGQVSVAEATEAARVTELNSLKGRTVALKGQAVALESAAVIKCWD